MNALQIGCFTVFTKLNIYRFYYVYLLRSHNKIESPGACLLAMIRDEAEPNVSQTAMTPEEDEFECWYRQAIESGFCQDVPKKYLPIQQGEIMVRVCNDKCLSGYELDISENSQSLFVTSF